MPKLSEITWHFTMKCHVIRRSSEVQKNSIHGDPVCESKSDLVSVTKTFFFGLPILLCVFVPLFQICTDKHNNIHCFLNEIIRQ
jgi:hypothetical protein